MRIVKLLAFLLPFALAAGAAELATTASGKKVVLKDDHTWELFDPNKHLALRDLRAVNEQIQIDIKYKSVQWLNKETRSVLESDYADEKSIQDSLRRVPKGGVLYFRIGKKYLNANDPRYYTITIWDADKKPIYQKDVSEREAVDSDDGGVANLLVVPMLAKPKGKEYKVQVQDRVMKQIWEYTVPLDEMN